MTVTFCVTAGELVKDEVVGVFDEHEAMKASEPTKATAEKRRETDITGSDEIN